MGVVNEKLERSERSDQVRRAGGSAPTATQAGALTREQVVREIHAWLATRWRRPSDLEKHGATHG